MNINLLTARPLILASASPRRLQLLQQVGITPRVQVAQVEELSCLAPAFSPAELVAENARRKAAAIRQQQGSCDAWILAADTVVVCRGQLFGKPRDKAEAEAMLACLSDSWHSVFTGQCLLDGADGRESCRVSETRVRFAPLERAEIAAYVEGGEPLDKAGAYGIQGQAAAFVRELQGDYFAVIGLSLHLLREMLRELEGKSRKTL